MLSSWECPCCGRSIRSPLHVNAESAWMNQAVVAFSSVIVSGCYDGKGGIRMEDGTSIEVSGPFAMYHRACFELAGHPTFARPSAIAEDGGYMSVDHPLEPLSMRDVADIRTGAKRIKMRRQRAREKLHNVVRTGV